MRTFFRNNPTIFFGLCLPLFVLAVMLCFSIIPAMMVAPPRYDAVYAFGGGDNANVGLRIQVKDHKARLMFLGNVPYTQPIHLIRYNAATGTVKEISYTLPNDIGNSNKPQNTRIPVPELDNLTFDTSLTAPDGYNFVISQPRERPVTEIFLFDGPYQTAPLLSKKGRNVRLKAQYAYPYNAQFVGWVISK